MHILHYAYIQAWRQSFELSSEDNFVYGGELKI